VLVAVVLLLVAAGVFYQVRTFVGAPQVRRGRFGDAGTNQSVSVASIHRGDVRILMNALGAVTPLTTVTVNTQISGLLMKVGFKEGQLVHKGDFLAQIDPRPYEVALAEDQAQLARDEAILEQAQMDRDRYKTLSDQSSIARQTYEDQVWVVKQDQGTVDYDKAQIKAQQLNLTYCHIVAPADGRVGLRLIDPGNYVQTSTTSGIVVSRCSIPSRSFSRFPRTRFRGFRRVYTPAPSPRSWSSIGPTSNSWRPANSPRSTTRSTRPRGRFDCARISTTPPTSCFRANS